MGVIAQNSTDLVFERFVVEPSIDRKFSLAADGTHFVNCRGELSFTDCRFQNQFDDAINAHGLYHQVVRPLGPRSLRIRTLHPQHQGVDTLRPGDRIRLCRAPHIVSIAELTLASTQRLNSETMDLTFKTDLPTDLPPFHGNLRIENNTFKDCSAPKLKAASFTKITSDLK